MFMVFVEVLWWDMSGDLCLFVDEIVVGRFDMGILVIVSWIEVDCVIEVLIECWVSGKVVLMVD